MLNNIFNNIKAFGSSLASILKVCVLSRRPSRITSCPDPHETLLILGNGPALRSAIDNHLDIITAHPRMAVNFAANAPDFNSLKPNFYILADAHFFNGIASDINVAELWQNLATANWEMTLFVPASFKNSTPILPENISLAYYNLTPAEGVDSLSELLFNTGLAMPRPRNVLIPAIMMAIRLNYKNIALLGADHSWSKSLWVDDKNRVISVQPHFYKDNDKELDRVAQEYAGYHIHHIYRSLAIAFESYHHIKKYASKRGVNIINVTPDSFIDAFQKKSLEEIN